jgi:HK97 family phage portal protein
VSWFDRLVWDRRKARARTEERALTGVPWSVGPPLYPAGAVTFDRAASFGAVFGAWRYLADQIATLPLHAYRDLGDRRQRLGSLPQLFQQPAAQGTLVDWLYRAVIAMASRGNAVGLVTSRDGFGFPTGIEWTDPDDWRVDDEPPNGSLARPVWWLDGRHVPTENVVHIPWFPVPGRIWGLSPMGAYAAIVQTALGAQDYSRDWFTAGGTPVGTYQNTVKSVVDQTEAEAVKARLVKAIRTHEPVVFGKDWTYTAPTSIAPGEAQFVESQRLGATQIAAIYGVPPEKIGGEAGGALTYNTVELNMIAAQQEAVRPWVTKLEAAFFKLLPERQYVRFGMDAVIRTDLKTRMEIAEIARRIGYRNIDELRELDDLEPLPNGQGATYTPLPLLEKGIGSVPGPGEKPAPPAPRPAPEAEQEPGQRPRLRPVAGED